MSDISKQIVKDVENGILPKILDINDITNNSFGLQPYIDNSRNYKLDILSILKCLYRR